MSKRKLKVAMICDDTNRGGAWQIAHNIANGVAGKECEIQFIFLNEYKDGFKDDKFVGKPIFRFDFNIISYLSLAFFPSKSQLNYRPLEEALVEFMPDIIHVHSHIIYLKFLESFVRKQSSKVPHLFFTDHSQRIRRNEGSRIKNFALGFAFKKLLSQFKVVFVSEYALKTARKWNYGFEKDSIISNAVDINVFTPPPHKKDRSIHIVVYFARIHRAKGFDVLIEAWKNLGLANTELHLYGAVDDGHLLDKVLKEGTNYGIRYCGVTKESANIMREAHLGVFPSYREGLPLAMLEMMASGLAVVASDIPEIASIITNKKDGVLFKCGDAEDLCEKLKKLITNQKMANEIGFNARLTIEEKYSHSISDSYLALYKQYF